MAHGPSGDPYVYFVEFAGNKLGRIDVNTDAITEYPIPTALAAPFGLSTGTDGSMWLTELGGNKIARFNVETNQFTEYSLPNTLAAPIGRVVQGWDGGLWFAELAANQIGRFDPTTGIFTSYSVPSPLAGPCDGSAGPDDAVYFMGLTGGVLIRVGAN
jgi:virginiamycin B lyase